MIPGPYGRDHPRYWNCEHSSCDPSYECQKFYPLKFPALSQEELDSVKAKLRESLTHRQPVLISTPWALEPECCEPHKELSAIRKRMRELESEPWFPGERLSDEEIYRNYRETYAQTGKSSDLEKMLSYVSEEVPRYEVPVKRKSVPVFVVACCILGFGYLLLRFCGLV